jgi:hypothetical protein
VQEVNTLTVDDVSRARLTWWMWEAVANGDEEQARRWIRHGANIWQPWTGAGASPTPLQLMVDKRNIPMVRMLLEEGNVAKGDERINGALTAALRHGDLEMSRLLLEWGAHLNEGVIEDLAQNNNASNAILVMLFQHGATLGESARDRDLVVRRSLQEFNPELLRILIEHGLEFEIRAHVDSIVGRKDPTSRGMQPFQDYFAALDARSKAKLALEEAQASASLLPPHP